MRRQIRWLFALNWGVPRRDVPSYSNLSDISWQPAAVVFCVPILFGPDLCDLMRHSATRPIQPIEMTVEKRATALRSGWQ
jgi:hypothetical protein